MAQALPTIAQAVGRQRELVGISDSPGLDVALLLSECLGKPRSYLYAWPERQLTLAEADRFSALLARRLAGEPVAYILGYRDFWSLLIKVSPYTLIPRPDTECLVEQALSMTGGDVALRVLDLGTGTGAIALALARERPSWRVLGVDSVAEAVALARENARALNIQNVQFRQSDWFAGLEGEAPFQMIVANPPYIDEADIHLTQGDVRFEPRSALVAGDAGLADLAHIISFAPDHLQAGGVLLLEHGYNQADNVRKLMAARQFTHVTSGRDYGGNDRISWGVWRGG